MTIFARACSSIMSVLTFTKWPPQTSTPFPYTTLFRSRGEGRAPRRDEPSRQRAHRDPSELADETARDRQSTRLNSSHRCTSYAVFCLKKKNRSVLRSLTRSPPRVAKRAETLRHSCTRG